MENNNLNTEITENTENSAVALASDTQVEMTGSTNIATFSWTGNEIYSSTYHMVGKYSIFETDTDGNLVATDHGATRMYIKLTLPTLPLNPRIKKAELKLFQEHHNSETGEHLNIGLYEIGSFTEGDTAGELDGYPTECTKMQAAESGNIVCHTFDLTAAVNSAYRNTSSTIYLALKLLDETYDKQNYIQFGGIGSDNEPTFVINYESSYGVTNSYRTHTHNIGKFGQGSIDVQLGNLMFESEDFAFGGSRMPVTVKRYYNSALAEYQYSENDSIKLNTTAFNLMNLGYGWKLNLMQSIKPAEFNNEGEACQGYVYIGENGEATYFKESKLTGVIESDSYVYNLFEDVDGGGLIYDPAKQTLKNGEETYYFDGSYRLIKITDGNNNSMEITYTAEKLSSVTDGAGRVFTFDYDENNFLTKITAPDETSISYTYANNLLTKITYPDNTTANLTYISKRPATVVIKNSEGTNVYKVAYTHSSGRVIKAVEYGVNNGSFVKGTASAYSYDSYGFETEVTTVVLADSDEGETEDTATTTHYGFDYDGNVIAEYICLDKNDDTRFLGINGNSDGINIYSGDGGINTAEKSTNFLLGHGFSDLSHWTALNTNTETLTVANLEDEKAAKFGRNTLNIISSDSECTANGVGQETVTLAAGEYNFSAYIKPITDFTGDDGKGAYIRVMSGDTVLAESDRLYKKDTDYIRLSAPFELTAEQTVQVQILVNGAGEIYADAAQLEKRSYANPYNLIENGNFSHEASEWITGADSYNYPFGGFETASCIMVNGKIDSENNASQKIYVKSDRTTRETFTLSGWANGFGIPVREREGMGTTAFRLRAVIHYNDTEYDDTSTETFTADFPINCWCWRYASVQFSKSKYRTVDYIEVFCDYNYNTSYAYFDDIQLTRDSIETDLTAEDFAIIEDEPETEGTTSADTEETEVADFEELLDEFGNTLTETTFQDGEFGTVYRSFEYDEDGNNLTVETDARGNKTVYTVDPVTSRNTAVTDRCGNKTAYEYDSVGRTTKVTSKKADDTEIANVSYSYDTLDNMTEIVRGDGLKYVLSYNAFRNLEAIGIDGKAENLVKYTYKTGNGKLKRIDYANGDYMHATYNGLGQMIAEKWYDSTDTLTAHYKYTYDGEGNIVRSIDILAEKEYNYTYEDGAIQRATEYNITLDDSGIVVGKVLTNTIQYYYNKENTLVKKRVIFADGTEQVTDFENPEEGNTIAKLTVNDKTITSHSKNDSFGRTEFEELQLGTGVISRQFDYHAGKATEEHIENGKLKSTPTTQLVSKITLSNGRTISYEYDAEERITKVVDSLEGTTEYTYDELGQLLTETVNGIVINTMTYDNYGNIVAKDDKQYAYDSTWKDLLVSVDNDTITYDAQGNPTEYLGHNLVWEKGRQLKQFDGNIYTYNANGIRNSKTVDGIRHDFVLDGVKILKETYGSHTIETLYDNADSVCGIIYNGTPYYFLKNLQGDVISITNADGEVVANYTYDAWGKVLSISGDNIHIGAINPYRYRGYYFDSEINMYYLQSRYYDPEIGRFLNGDVPEFAIIEQSALGHNLFGYCINSPTLDSDEGGNISFSGVKKAIKNIVNNIKSFIKNLVNYIKKQFKKFLSKVSCHFNKGYLRIPTTPIGYLIDAVITTISGLVRGALLKGGFSLLKLWFKSNRPALKTFVKNTVVPLLKNTDELLNSLVKYIASRFKRKCAWTITKSRIENRILGKYDFYKWISAVSSVGSFIATVLDVLDGKWDNYLAI